MQKSNQFVKVLNKLDARLQHAKSQSEDLRMFYEIGELEYAFDKALDMEETVEQAVFLSRMLPAYTGSPNAKQEVDKRIKSFVPIEIGYTEEGWFSIKIPLLLPKKAKGSADYIRAILYPAMREFFMSRPPVRFDDCVLIYRHVYDRQRPERKKRDHDNIEINMVSDIVAMYAMPDDGPDICSHYYCSRESSVERTEVYVVPKDDFIRFIQVESTMPDKGVVLNENKP